MFINSSVSWAIHLLYSFLCIKYNPKLLNRNLKNSIEHCRTVGMLTKYFWSFGHSLSFHSNSLCHQIPKDTTWRTNLCFQECEAQLASCQMESKWYSYKDLLHILLSLCGFLISQIKTPSDDEVVIKKAVHIIFQLTIYRVTQNSRYTRLTF